MFILAWKNKETGVEGHAQPTHGHLAQAWADAMNEKYPKIYHYVASEEEFQSTQEPPTEEQIMAEVIRASEFEAKEWERAIRKMGLIE